MIAKVAARLARGVLVLSSGNTLVTAVVGLEEISTIAMVPQVEVEVTDRRAVLEIVAIYIRVKVAMLLAILN